MSQKLTRLELAEVNSIPGVKFLGLELITRTWSAYGDRKNYYSCKGKSSPFERLEDAIYQYAPNDSTHYSLGETDRVSEEHGYKMRYIGNGDFAYDCTGITSVKDIHPVNYYVISGYEVRK